MRPVLEVQARPDTAEARRAGQDALGVAAVLVLSFLGATCVASARPDAPGAPSPTARTLPVVVCGGSTSGLDGAEPAEGGALIATGRENGRVALLAGGQAWRDYTMRARVRWLAGRRLSIVVRAADADSYAAFVLEGPTVRLEEVRAGVAATLARGVAPDYRGQAFDAVVSVRGRDVSLALDGATVASGRLRRSGSGTAGLGVWDPSWGAAGLRADYVRVERGVSGAAAGRGGSRPVVEHVDRGE